jgi:hypothetical protein
MASPICGQADGAGNKESNFGRMQSLRVCCADAARAGIFDKAMVYRKRHIPPRKRSDFWAVASKDLFVANFDEYWTNAMNVGYNG